jgi:hypothetical protein
LFLFIVGLFDGVDYFDPEYILAEAENKILMGEVYLSVTKINIIGINYRYETLNMNPLELAVCFHKNQFFLE